MAEEQNIRKRALTTLANTRSHLLGNAHNLTLVITSLPHMLLPLHMVVQAIAVPQIAVTDDAAENRLHPGSPVFLAEIFWKLPVLRLLMWKVCTICIDADLILSWKSLKSSGSGGG